jgi:hypothetical protein
MVVSLGKDIASLITGSLPFHGKANERRFEKFVNASIQVQKKE